MKRRGRLERTGAVAVKAPARVDAHQPAAVRRLRQQRLAARVQRPQQRVVCQPHEFVSARVVAMPPLASPALVSGSSAAARARARSRTAPGPAPNDRDEHDSIEEQSRRSRNAERAPAA